MRQFRLLEGLDVLELRGHCGAAGLRVEKEPQDALWERGVLFGGQGPA